MRVFDQIDPLTLDRRDWQLWMLALAMILVLASGLALLMYPAVFSSPLALTGPILRRSFFGFCVLCLLLTGYLMDRQLTIRQLRRQLVEDERRMIDLRDQASADLLGTLPGFDHFQDRLAMEFRRAANTQQPLSLLVVRLKPSREVSDTGQTSTAFGDAAKALIRRLRREDSIYLFRLGLFGIVLPSATGAGANRVAERLADGLTDASGASGRFSFDVRMVNYPEHSATAREMEQMAASCFPETRMKTEAA